MNRISFRRFGVILRRLSPLDRIVLAIVVLYAAFRVIGAFGRAVPFTSFFGFLTFLAALYFAVRLLPWIRTKLLWGLRSRLIVAYVFIAVVPVVLLLAMAGVAAYLLHLQFGAHLLSDHLGDRISTISTDTDAISDAIEMEASKGGPIDDSILARRAVAGPIAAARASGLDLHVFVNRGRQLVGNGTPSLFRPCGIRGQIMACNGGEQTRRQRCRCHLRG